MARRAQPLSPRVALPGWAALAALLALTLGAAALVAAMGVGGGRLSAADWRAVEFTVTQATLSAALSVAGAVPLARALSRRRFRGRETMAALLGAPFIAPTVVAALGVLAVWGRSGWASDLSTALGGPRFDVYGMPGVLIAHVFFNLPLAARLIMLRLGEIAPERWRVAAQLGLEGRALFRVVEWPAIRAAAPGAFAAVFAVCATSFAVALMLGGGPRATTVELAIYEAAAYEFDLSRAARLAAVQLAICAAAATLALALAAPPAAAPGAMRTGERWDGRGAAARAIDVLALLLIVGFLAAPLAAVALRGIEGFGAIDAGEARAIALATARSLAVALGATALCLGVSLSLAAFVVGLEATGRGRRGRAVELAGFLPLAASPFVLGVALFVALRPVVDPVSLALPLTALTNAAMATPFALRALVGPMRAALAERGRLADSLGLTGRTRIAVLYAPRMRAPLGFAAGLAAALSAGDLGVIALFAAPDAPTLPLLMQTMASSRRIDEAHGAALVLLALSLALFWAFDRAGRAR